MSRFKLSAKLIVASLLSVFLIAGCSSTTASSEGELSGSLDPQPLENPVTLKVSVSGTSELWSAVRLADSTGEFAKENISLEYVTLPSTESVPALVSGSVDVVALGVTIPFFNAIAGGAGIKITFLGPDLSPDAGFYVQSDLADQGPAALKGKKVGLSQGWGQIGAVPIRDYLATAGLTLSDVEIVTVPLEDLAVSLDSGVIDATWLQPPSTNIFIENGKAKRVIGNPNNEAGGAYAFGTRLLSEEPEIGQAFIRAMMRTVNTYLLGDYKANAETVDLLATALGLTADEIKKTKSTNFAVYTENQIQTERTLLYTQAQELWLELGGLLTFESPLPADDYIDWSFVQRILDNQ